MKRKRIQNKVLTTEEVSKGINELTREYPSSRYDIELIRSTFGNLWVVVVWDRGE